MLILLLLLTPVCALILAGLNYKSYRTVRTIGIAATIVEFLLTTIIAFALLMESSDVILLPYFKVDAFGSIILLLTGLVGVIANFFGIGYLREEMRKEMIYPDMVAACYGLMQVFLVSLFVAATTTHPIIMWIAVEATTISTALLISAFNRSTDVEAGWKYLIINSVGLLLALFGTLLFLLASQNHSYISWENLLEDIKTASNPELVRFAFIFILVGYGTKMGLVPMHTWKPDAYNKGLLPIVALLASAVMNVSVLALLRFKVLTDAVVNPVFTQNLFIFFGTISVILPAFIIYSQRNFKRMLAYSSVEHSGMILLGLGFGGLAAVAAVLHLIYHSLFKSLLFMTAGNISVKYSSSERKNIQGLIDTMPITSILWGCGLLAIVGMPPFGIFWTEFMILSQGAHMHLPVVIAVAFSLILVFVGLSYTLFSMLFGTKEQYIPNGELNKFMVYPLIILLIIATGLSLYVPPFLQSLIQSITFLKP